MEEYEIITAISVVKWVHLNWGDMGLKRFFKRVFRNLSSESGRFILELPNFEAYNREKQKLTDEMQKNFSNMSFYPDDFIEYLLSDEVKIFAWKFLMTFFKL